MVLRRFVLISEKLSPDASKPKQVPYEFNKHPMIYDKVMLCHPISVFFRFLLA